MKFLLISDKNLIKNSKENTFKSVKTLIEKKCFESESFEWKFISSIIGEQHHTLIHSILHNTYYFGESKNKISLFHLFINYSSCNSNATKYLREYRNVLPMTDVILFCVDLFVTF